MGDEQPPAKPNRLPQFLYAGMAAFSGCQAYICLQGYLYGAPSPLEKGGRWSRDVVVPLYTSPEQAFGLAVAFALVALLFASFALRPPGRLKPR
jgi:hypothetical protein